MSQAMSTKFSMLFMHTYGKIYWKFGCHSSNYFFVHGLSVPGYWEAINTVCTLVFKSRRSLWDHGWCHKKYFLSIFKGICMNFSLELKFFILSHPVTSKQPHKIVQRLMKYLIGHLSQLFLNCRMKCKGTYYKIRVLILFSLIKRKNIK